jgi:hypothetical protein
MDAGFLPLRTGETHVLMAIGFFMVIAGLIIMLLGDKQIPVRGGIVLRIFDSRRRSEEGLLPGWSYRFLFGGAVIFGGVMVLLKAFRPA